MESCSHEYFILFTPGWMHILVPTVISTSDATYSPHTAPTTEQQKEEQQTFRCTIVVAVIGILCQTLSESIATQSHTILVRYQQVSELG